MESKGCREAPLREARGEFTSSTADIDKKGKIWFKNGNVCGSAGQQNLSVSNRRKPKTE